MRLFLIGFSIGLIFSVAFAKCLCRYCSLKDCARDAVLEDQGPENDSKGN